MNKEKLLEELKENRGRMLIRLNNANSDYDKGLWRGAFDTIDALIIQIKRGDYDE